MPESHEALVRRTLGGDVHAREALAMVVLPIIRKKVGQTVFYFGSARVRRNIRGEIDDLTQEVCMMLFMHECRALQRFDPAKGSLAAFVGRIAYCRTVDLLRTRRFHPQREDLADDDRFFELRCVLGFEERVVQRDLLRQVFDRVRAQLRPGAQAVLQLLFVEGRSIAEVVEATELSAAAVYKQKARLNMRLRDELAQLASEGGGHDA